MPSCFRDLFLQIIRLLGHLKEWNANEGDVGAVVVQGAGGKVCVLLSMMS